MWGLFDMSAELRREPPVVNIPTDGSFRTNPSRPSQIAILVEPAEIARRVP
jgi:hypothetical protein